LNVNGNWLLISLLFEVDEQDCLFQQDGVTAHRENSAMQCSASSLMIALILDACGPLDLRTSPPDFNLWGFRWKALHTAEKLKQNIELGISNVTAEAVHQVAANTRKE
jgi:hypothetical protein